MMLRQWRFSKVSVVALSTRPQTQAMGGELSRGQRQLDRATGTAWQAGGRANKQVENLGKRKKIERSRRVACSCIKPSQLS